MQTPPQHRQTKRRHMHLNRYWAWSRKMNLSITHTRINKTLEDLYKCCIYTTASSSQLNHLILQLTKFNKQGTWGTVQGFACPPMPALLCRITKFYDSPNSTKRASEGLCRGLCVRRCLLYFVESPSSTTHQIQQTGRVRVCAGGCVFVTASFTL